MSNIRMSDTPVNVKIHEWLDDPADPGDWVGVFENHDLGHPDLGARFALLYGAEQWDAAEVGKTHGPDTSLGLGWRYILIGKFRDADDAIEAMEWGRCRQNEPHDWVAPEFVNIRKPDDGAQCSVCGLWRFINANADSGSRSDSSDDSEVAS